MAFGGRWSFWLRLWLVIASPSWTLLLLLILVLAATLGLFLPQAEAIPPAAQAQWLAALQGRYGRWTGLLSNLGLFDISRALWVQALLMLLAYQGLVATVEGSSRAWRRVHLGAEAYPDPPPPFAQERPPMHLLCPLDQGVTQVESAFRRLGCQVITAQKEELVAVEVIRYPWLSMGRPLAHGGVVVACLAALLGGRLGWQEGPVSLSPGQTHMLRNSPRTALHLQNTGLARQSFQPYSWVSLVRDDQMRCEGAITPGQALKCGGMSIQQSGTEPALHISGHDRLGRSLNLQPLRGEAAAAPQIILYLPTYVPDGYAVLPERGLMLHIQVFRDQPKPHFQLGIYRGQRRDPLLQRDVTDPTSLTLDDLTLTFTPTQVPSFRLSHYPTRPLRWVGLSLSLVGLLMSLAMSSCHLWIRMEEQGGETCLRLWRGLPLSFGAAAVRDIESRMGLPSTSGTA
jgi:hypothetical protein